MSRSTVVGSRMSEADRSLLEAAAALENLGTSVFLRAAGLAAATEVAHHHRREQATPDIQKKLETAT